MSAADPQRSSSPESGRSTAQGHQHGAFCRVQMTQLVFEALKEQEKATRGLSEFVFCNRSGKPLAHKNVTNRVWYPLDTSRGRRKPR